MITMAVNGQGVGAKVSCDLSEGKVGNEKMNKKKKIQISWEEDSVKESAKRRLAF